MKWLERMIRECALSTWEGEPGRCRWCDAPLPKRRRRWCSDVCADAFHHNHAWNAARGVARKRDNERCVVCARDPMEVYRAALADGLSHVIAVRYLKLQVHHKTPVLGRHGEFSCLHHLDGLKTLCLYHHVEAHHGESTKANQLTFEEVCA